MADNRKLAQGLMMMTPAMRADLAGREQDIQRGKTVELLRRAGKEMYDNPIVNTAIGFAPVLGDIQAAGETMSALNRGAPWQETAGYAAGMLPFIPMVGKTVWHGSPHTFDKFDMSKIGTGEGAQSYGHGLYLAEARPVAEEYATNLSKDVFNVGGELFNPADIKHLNVRTLARKGDIDSAIKKATELAASDSPVADLAKLDLDLLQQAKAKGGFQEATGQLYKVDLPDEQIAKMLDWDKPLSEQAPEVQQAFRNTDFYKQAQDYYGQNPKQWHLDPEQKTGESLYQYMQAGIGDEIGGGMTPAQASEYLRQQGIPGIQYLDQASRNQAQRFIARSPQGGESVFNSAEEAQQFIENMAKRGHEFEYVDPNLTRNYVVFSDEIPQILERNGQPIAQALRDYRGSHTAPGPDFGAQLHDLTGGGQMYPDDVYSPNAYRFYGHGGPDVALDKETTKIAQSFRGKPDEMVDIYRAVPNETDITAINAGDWVTINPNYAKQHGESQLGGDYKILQQKVPAKTIWTNADSIHEYGYWPE